MPDIKDLENVPEFKSGNLTYGDLGNLLNSDNKKGPDIMGDLKSSVPQAFNTAPSFSVNLKDYTEFLGSGASTRTGINPEATQYDNVVKFDKEQSNIEALGNMFSKTLPKAANAFTGYFLDTFRTTDALDKRHQEEMMKEKELERKYPSFDAGGTSDFLEQLVPSMGYTAGTIGAAILENSAVALLTEGAGLAETLPSTLYRFGKLGKMFEYASGAKKFKNMFEIGKNAFEAGSAYKKGVQFLGLGLNGLATYQAANGESAMEGATAGYETAERLKEQYRNIHGFDANGEDLQRIMAEGKAASEMTYKMNMPILLASDLIQFGSVLMPSASKLAKESETLWKGWQVANKGTKLAPEFDLVRKTWKDAWKTATTLEKTMMVAGEMGKYGSFLSEGAEESLQRFASTFSQEYYVDDYNMTETDAFHKSFADMFSKDGFKEFLGGAIIGAIFQATPHLVNNRYTRKAFNLKDKEAIRENQLRDIVNDLNNSSIKYVLQDSGFVDLLRATDGANTLNNLQSESNPDGQDLFHIKNVKSQNLLSFAYTYLMRGRTDLLNEQLDSLASATPEELKQVYGIELPEGQSMAGFVEHVKGKVKTAQEYMQPLIEHFNVVHNGNTYAKHEENTYKEALKYKEILSDKYKTTDVDELNKRVSTEEKVLWTNLMNRFDNARIANASFKDGLKQILFTYGAMKDSEDRIISLKTATQAANSDHNYYDAFKLSNSAEALQLYRDLVQFSPVEPKQGEKGYSELKRDYDNYQRKIEISKKVLELHKQEGGPDVKELRELVKEFAKLDSVNKTVTNVSAELANDNRINDVIRLEKRHGANKAMYMYLQDPANFKDYVEDNVNAINDFYESLESWRKEYEIRKTKRAQQQKTQQTQQNQQTQQAQAQAQTAVTPTQIKNSKSDQEFKELIERVIEQITGEKPDKDVNTIPNNKLGEYITNMFSKMKYVLNGDTKEAQRLYKKYVKQMHPDVYQDARMKILAEAFFKALKAARVAGNVELIEKLKKGFDEIRDTLKPSENNVVPQFTAEQRNVIDNVTADDYIAAMNLNSQSEITEALNKKDESIKSAKNLAELAYRFMNNELTEDEYLDQLGVTKQNGNEAQFHSQYWKDKLIVKPTQTGKTVAKYPKGAIVLYNKKRYEVVGTETDSSDNNIYLLENMLGEPVVNADGTKKYVSEADIYPVGVMTPQTKAYGAITLQEANEEAKKILDETNLRFADVHILENPNGQYELTFKKKGSTSFEPASVVSNAVEREPFTALMNALSNQAEARKERERIIAEINPVVDTFLVEIASSSDIPSLERISDLVKVFLENKKEDIAKAKLDISSKLFNAIAEAKSLLSINEETGFNAEGSNVIEKSEIEYPESSSVALSPIFKTLLQEAPKDSKHPFFDLLTTQEDVLHAQGFARFVFNNKSFAEKFSNGTYRLVLIKDSADNDVFIKGGRRADAAAYMKSHPNTAVITVQKNVGTIENPIWEIAKFDENYNDSNNGFGVFYNTESDNDLKVQKAIDVLSKKSGSSKDILKDKFDQQKVVLSLAKKALFSTDKNAPKEIELSYGGVSNGVLYIPYVDSSSVSNSYGNESEIIVFTGKDEDAVILSDGSQFVAESGSAYITRNGVLSKLTAKTVSKETKDLVDRLMTHTYETKEEVKAVIAFIEKIVYLNSGYGKFIPSPVAGKYKINIVEQGEVSEKDKEFIDKIKSQLNDPNTPEGLVALFTDALKKAKSSSNIYHKTLSDFETNRNVPSGYDRRVLINISKKELKSVTQGNPTLAYDIKDGKLVNVKDFDYKQYVINNTITRGVIDPNSTSFKLLTVNHYFKFNIEQSAVDILLGNAQGVTTNVPNVKSTVSTPAPTSTQTTTTKTSPTKNDVLDLQALVEAETGFRIFTYSFEPQLRPELKNKYPELYKELYDLHLDMANQMINAIDDRQEIKKQFVAGTPLQKAKNANSLIEILDSLPEVKKVYDELRSRYNEIALKYDSASKQTNAQPATTQATPSDIEAEKTKITDSEFTELKRLAKFFLENPNEPSTVGSVINKYPALFKAATDIEKRRKEELDNFNDPFNLNRKIEVRDENGRLISDTEDSINTKYDAELAALQGTQKGPSVNTPSAEDVYLSELNVKIDALLSDYKNELEGRLKEAAQARADKDTAREQKANKKIKELTKKINVLEVRRKDEVEKVSLITNAEDKQKIRSLLDFQMTTGLTLTEDEKQYTNLLGKLFKRVTSLVKTIASTNSSLEASKIVGTRFDTLYRDIINGTLSSDIDSYNLGNKKQVLPIIEHIVKWHENLKKEGYIVFANETSIASTLSVNGAVVPVAGTMDLFLYNTKTNKFEIRDIKTTKESTDTKFASGFDNYYKNYSYENPKTKVKEMTKAEEHSRQLSIYAFICSNEFNIPIDSLSTENFLLMYTVGANPIVSSIKVAGPQKLEKKEKPEDAIKIVPSTISNSSTKPTDINEFLSEVLESELYNELMDNVELFNIVQRHGKENVTMLFNVFNSDQWGKFTKEGIILYKNAIKGTGYHEGYHRFTQLYLTKEQKAMLYKEVRDNFKTIDVIVNKQLVTIPIELAEDIDIEEFLAREFARYGLSDGKIMFGKRVETKNIFQKIWDFLKQLISGKIDIETAFAHAYKKPVFESLLYKPNLNNALWNNLASGVLDANNEEILSPEKAAQYVRYTNGIIWSILNRPNINTGLAPIKARPINELLGSKNNMIAIHVKVKQEIKSIIEKLKANPVKGSKDVIDDLQKIYDNYGFFLNYYNTYSRVETEKISKLKDINEINTTSIDQDESDDINYSEDPTKASNQMDPIRTADPRIKQLLRVLPVHEYNPSLGRGVIKYNRFGLTEPCDFARVWNSMLQELAGTLDAQDFFRKLNSKELQKKIPEIAGILESIPDLDSFGSNGLYKSAFISALYQSFTKPIVDIYSHKTINGRPQLIKENRGNFDALRNRAESTFHSFDGRSKFVKNNLIVPQYDKDGIEIGRNQMNSADLYDLSNGVLALFTDINYESAKLKVQKDLKTGYTERTYPIGVVLKNKDAWFTRPDHVINFLNFLGFNIPETELSNAAFLKNIATPSMIISYKTLLGNLLFRATETNNIVPIVDLRQNYRIDRDTVIDKETTNLDKIIKILSEYTLLEPSLSATLATGERAYIVQQHNTYTLLNSFLSSVKNIKELENNPTLPIYNKDLNYFIIGSFYMSQMFDPITGDRKIDKHGNPVVIEVTNYSGNKDILKKTSDLEEIEKLSMNINDLFTSGKQDGLRLGDASTYLSVSLSQVNRDSNVIFDIYDNQDIFDNKLFKQIIKGYFECETEKVLRYLDVTKLGSTEESLNDFGLFGQIDIVDNKKSINFKEVLLEELKNNPNLTSKQFSEKYATEAFDLLSIALQKEIGIMMDKADLAGILSTLKRASEESESLDKESLKTQEKLDYTILEKLGIFGVEENERPEKVKSAFYNLMSRYVVNSFIMNHEESKIFGSDPSFFDKYKNGKVVSSSFSKRLRTANSSGSINIDHPALYDYYDSTQSLFSDRTGGESYDVEDYKNVKFVTSKDLMVDKAGEEVSKEYVVKDANGKSINKTLTLTKRQADFLESMMLFENKNYVTEKMLEYAEQILAYKEAMPTDGGAFYNPDWARRFLTENSNWEPTQEALYKLEILLQKEDREGLTEQEKELKDQLKLEAGDAVFPVIKAQLRTFVVKELKKKDGTTVKVVQQEIQKVAFAPLTYSTVRMSPKLMETYEKMVDNKLSYFVYDSGSKASKQNVVDSPSEFSPEDIQVRPKIHMKGQIKAYDVAKRETGLGTQIAKSIFGSMIDNGVPIDFVGTKEEYDNLTLEELKEKSPIGYRYNEYKRNYQILKNILQKELYDDMSLEKKNGVVTIKNMKLFIKALQEAVENDERADINIREFIEYSEENKGFKAPLDLFISRDRVLSLINGIIDEKIRRFKVKGAQLVQVPNIGFGDLPFYELEKDENGKIIVLPGTCILGMTKDYEYLLQKNHPDGEKIITIDRLNESIENKEWLNTYKDHLMNFTYRIPTQGTNSAGGLMVGKFLPSSMGGLIITCDGITVQSGGDNDNDKISALSRYIDKDGNIIGRLSKEETKAIKDKIKAIKKQISANSKSSKVNVENVGGNAALDEMIRIKAQELLAIRNEIEKIEAEQEANALTEDQEKIRLQQALNAFSSGKKKNKGISLEELQEKLGNTSEYRDTSLLKSLREKESSIENELESIQGLSTSRDNSYAENRKLKAELKDLQSKIDPRKIVINKIIDTYLEQILSPETYWLLVLPTAAIEMQKISENIGKKLGTTYKAPTGTQVALPSTNLRVHELQSQKRNLGIYAKSTVYSEQAKGTGLLMNKFRKIGNYETSITFPLLTEKEEKSVSTENNKLVLGANKDVAGNYTQLPKGELVTVAVDIANNPELISLGITDKNINVFMHLIQTNHDPERSVLFINQPILREMYRYATRAMGEENLSKTKALQRAHNLMYARLQGLLFGINRRISNITTDKKTKERFRGYAEKPFIYLSSLKFDNLDDTSLLQIYNAYANEDSDQLFTYYQKVVGDSKALSGDNVLSNDLNNIAGVDTNEVVSKINKSNSERELIELAKFINRQLAIISYNYVLQSEASSLTALSMYNDFDTAKVSGMADVVTKRNTYDEIIETNIFETESLREFLKESIPGMSNQLDIVEGINTLVFPVTSSKDFLDTLLMGETELLGETFKHVPYGLNRQAREKVIKTLTNDYVESIVKTFGTYKGMNFQDYVENLLKRTPNNNNVSLYDRLQAIKKNPELMDILSNYSVFDKIGNNQKYDLFNLTIDRGFDSVVSDRDMMIMQLRDLANHSNETIRSFFNDFIILGFGQSGYNKSRDISFADLIPMSGEVGNNELLNVMVNALNQYNSLDHLSKKAFTRLFFIYAFYNNPRIYSPLLTKEESSEENNYDLFSAESEDDMKTKIPQNYSPERIKDYKIDGTLPEGIRGSFNVESSPVTFDTPNEIIEALAKISKNADKVDVSIKLATDGIQDSLTFYTTSSNNYVERTAENASADVTLSIAVDFKTGGEKQTKTFAENRNKGFMQVPLRKTRPAILEINEAYVDDIVKLLNDKNAKTLNIAGNGITRFKDTGYTQEDLDFITYDLIKKIVNSPKLNGPILKIITGGQTGLDESGAKAGLLLGIPVVINTTSDWKFRVSEDEYNQKYYGLPKEETKSEDAVDVSDEVAFKARFQTEAMVALSRKVDEIFEENKTKTLLSNNQVGAVKADIPQNNVSGVESNGSIVKGNQEVIDLLGPRATSIDMIAAGLRTRTTRPASFMMDTNLKVGDIIKHFGKSADGSTKNILAKVTAIHTQSSPEFKNTWYKEGWSEDSISALDKFSPGAVAIEFEIIDATSDKVTNIYTNETNGFKNLSNLYNGPVVIDWNGTDITFATVEHAYQTLKAMFGGDQIAAGKIMVAKDGFEAQKLGSKNGIIDWKNGKTIEDWDKVSADYLEHVMRLAFDQNENAKNLLLKTGDTVLTHKNLKKPDMSLGKWESLFPAILTKIRTELKAKEPIKKEVESTTPKGNVIVNQNGLIIKENAISTEDSIKLINLVKPVIETTSYKQTKGSTSFDHGMRWTRINSIFTTSNTPEIKEKIARSIVTGNQLSGQNITEQMIEEAITKSKTLSSKEFSSWLTRSGFPLYVYAKLDRFGNPLPKIPTEVKELLGNQGIDISEYEASYNSVYDHNDGGSLIIHQDNTEQDATYPIITISLGRPMKFRTYELKNPEIFNIVDPNGNTPFNMAKQLVMKTLNISGSEITVQNIIELAQKAEKVSGKPNIVETVNSLVNQSFTDSKPSEHTLNNGTILVFSGNNRNVLHEIVFDKETDKLRMPEGFPKLLVNKAYSGLGQKDKFENTDDYRVVLTLRRVTPGSNGHTVVNQKTSSTESESDGRIKTTYPEKIKIGNVDFSSEWLQRFITLDPIKTENDYNDNTLDNLEDDEAIFNLGNVLEKSTVKEMQEEVRKILEKEVNITDKNQLSLFDENECGGGM